MEIVRKSPFDDQPAPARARPLSVAIGNFDGVHRGHQAVIDAARRKAQTTDGLVGVVTFEPHPRQFFQPNAAPFRLTPEPLKARKLAALGVDVLFDLPFDAELAALSAERFASKIIAGDIGARHVVVGEDFHFGAKRSGDAAALTAFGEQFGFTVEVVRKIGEAAETSFSSSAARAALLASRPQAAAAILGDWHRIEGVVEKGDQRGRDLGYPTANLSLGDALRPAYGIYATRAEVLDGPHEGVYDAVSSLGVRPTFDKKVDNFETYLFDFAGDIYGATLSVSLIAYLRPEEKFDSVDALIRQMDVDSENAREALKRFASL